MQFTQLAESLSAAPLSFSTSSIKPYGFLEDAKASKYALFTPGEMSGWVQGNVSQNRLSTVGTTLGSRSTGATIIGAVERAMTQDTLLGVMYSRTESQSKMLDDAGTVKSEQNMIGVYGQKLLDDIKLTGIVTMGRNKYESARNIRINTTSETGLARYDGNTTQLSLGVSRQLDYENMVLEPFALASYTINKTDPFKETSANAFGLSVGNTKARDLTLTMGAVFTQDVEVAGYPAKLKFKPAARVNNQIQRADATIAVGGSSTGLSAGRAIDRITTLLAGEVQILVSKTQIWKFGADLEKSTNNSNTKLFAQYEMKFH
jgi:outer membrane autotransporter protein